MKVTVKYTAQAKQFAGVGCEEIEVPDSTNVTQFIQSIGARSNSELRNLLVDFEGTPRLSYLVFIGDRCLRGNSNEALKPNDEITIMSMISGG